MRERQDINAAMLNDAYFSNLSLLDWVGMVLMAPLLLALLTLIVYIVAGMTGSIPRRRRLARESRTKSTRTPAPRQTPGD